MVDYSEGLLDISKSLQQAYKLLLSGKKIEAVQELYMLSRKSDRLSHWLTKEISKNDNH